IISLALSANESWFGRHQSRSKIQVVDFSAGKPDACIRGNCRLEADADWAKILKGQERANTVTAHGSQHFLGLFIEVGGCLVNDKVGRSTLEWGNAAAPERCSMGLRYEPFPQDG